MSKIYRIGGIGLLSRRKIDAVEHVSFSLGYDEPVITALVGESGSGKSTLANMILGLTFPSSGDILYKGRNVTDWIKRDKKSFYREVQPIFQDPYSVYNPFYRVERVLEIIMRNYNLASTKGDIKEKTLVAMKEIGLRPEDIVGRYPHQLSGGERQRIMLARILLIHPRLIVADEPISMIDVSLRASFMNQLQSFKKNLGISCLYITHDLNNARYISNRMIVLCRARIVEEGPTAEVIKNPLHPYTQLLMESIPIPDPRKRWKDKTDLAKSTSRYDKTSVESLCVFSDRCPHVKNKCQQKRPELIVVSPKRKVACFCR